MTEVFDLDALASEGEPFKYRFGGEDYELPADLDVKVLGVLDKDPERGLMLILGDEQWKRMVDSPQVFGLKSLKALLDKYAKHLGFDSLGGFSASASRSSSTALK